MDSVLMFPTPFPDETITSLVTRYHQMSGSLSVRRTLTDLFGFVTRSYASDLPCYLAHLESASGCTGLADDHTLLPYFEPFLSAEKYQRAREQMQSSHGIGLKLQLGITAAGFEKFHARRYCPRCVAADFAAFGVSYWHVCHQAAGNHVCLKHHCYLHRVLAEPRKGDFNQLVLPSEMIGRHNPDATQPLAAQYFSRLAKLAALIEWGILNPKAIARLFSDDYLNFVTNRAGFILNGRVCASRIEKHFRDLSFCFPKKYEFLRLFEQHHGHIAWPLNLLRKRKFNHHPLLFYMYLNCFDIDVRCLVEDYTGGAKYYIPPKHPSLLIESNSNNSEKTVRRQSFELAYAFCPAKKTDDYSWLYRNDREWLHSYISAHRKPTSAHHFTDWAVRDCELAVKVNAAVIELRAMAGVPIQISLAAICRFLFIPPDTFRHQHNLPKSTMVIRDNLETRHDYQLRKLAWAARALVAERINCTRSRLLRKANIRVCCLSDHEILRFM